MAGLRLDDARLDVMDSIKMPRAVAEVYKSYPKQAQAVLVSIRAMIMELAQDDAAIGPIFETLKWGEPSYLTQESGAGTTVRLAASPKQPDKAKILVNCRTSLIADFKNIYADAFDYEGSRAILLPLTPPFQQPAIRHFLSLALKYHLT